LNQLRLLTDLDLLVALCSEAEDEYLYAEFVKRFHKELQDECLLICKTRKLDTHVGKQIANEVFEKLRRYKTFKQKEVKLSSSHKGILVYLFKIARNLFTDWHNKEKRAREPYLNKSYFDEIHESLHPPEGVDLLLWKKETALKIFSKLNAKEKVVLLADIEHKKQQRYLPDEITDMLSETLNVQKATVRKIRERGINKIKNAIDEINQQ
jgi:DNA-directed RNA polymerase specialized sigma24 family protein